MSRPYKLVWTALIGEYVTATEAYFAMSKIRPMKRGEKLVILSKDSGKVWTRKETKDAEVRGGVRVQSGARAARKKEGAKVAGRTPKRSGRKDRGR